MAAVGGPVPPAVHEPAAAMRWLGKPGPAYPGRFHSQGASAPLGGRAEPRLSPTGRRPPRKGSIGICGAWSPEGRARAKRVHGGGDSPPGSRRPSRPLPVSREGAVRPTGPATAATAYLWRRGPAAQGQPRPSPGPNGARRPGASPGQPRRNRGGAPRPPAGGVGGGGQRSPRALRPLGPNRGEKPPLGLPTGGPTPRPHRAGGLLFVRGFVKVRLCAGVALLQPSRPVA
jgi:translation initiation factor IF-2